MRKVVRWQVLRREESEIRSPRRTTCVSIPCSSSCSLSKRKFQYYLGNRFSRSMTRFVDTRPLYARRVEKIQTKVWTRQRYVGKCEGRSFDAFSSLIDDAILIVEYAHHIPPTAIDFVAAGKQGGLGLPMTTSLGCCRTYLHTLEHFPPLYTVSLANGQPHLPRSPVTSQG